ncbi:hypothetical protein [Polyangium sp. 15x6]|uniref:hypothetical protein n=1 Tax=Polyangium sp. 15x6 TaxID=3042687 RepID=UPI00249CB3E0|nr:hypothetical protein [Polyangium sp. 15x6]MDI3282108.1 hypothetical protein [Polyangium sp. 15x6]
MPYLGLGACSAGSTGAGVGEAYGLNSSAGQLYLDDQRVQQNAAAIDTVTGDLVRDPQTGMHRGMESVAQQVYLALRTLRGSSVVKNLGFAFKFRVISETTAQKVRDAVNEALKDLVLRRLISVERIDVERVKVTAISILVVWKNLTNGETNTTRFSPNG